MRIGIVGDTHGSLPAMRKVLASAPPVEYWLHTGDHAADSNFLRLETKLPVISVLGNCDRIVTKDEKPDEYITLEGHKIWVTHGNKYLHENGEAELAWWARKLEMEIVVFGHTHVPLVKWYGDVLLINPGSPVLPRSETGESFAVLELQANKKPEAKIIKL